MSGARVTIDDDIFSNMPGMEDEAEDTTQDTGADQGDSENNGQDTRTADRTGQSSREDTPQQTDDPARIVKRQDGLQERQSADDPRRRDLVDPVTGQVVARGGIERRVYEQGKRSEREATALKKEVDQLRAQHRGAQQYNQVGTQLGLSPEVQITAMRVMADFVKDPVRTVEYLIAEVKGKGYNIPSLQGQGQTTDMEALAKLLDTRLAPFTQKQQQEQQVIQAREKAKEDLDNFLENVPDARSNLDIIAEMITGDQSLNLHSAYTRFLLWCSANQLDPTQHVGPQLQERQRVAQTPPGEQPRQTRPLPGARQLNGNSVPVGSRITHDENSEWSAIIAESLVEAGMQR